jgi:NADH-quinone oxidoreductase subunit N
MDFSILSGLHNEIATCILLFTVLILQLSGNIVKTENWIKVANTLFFFNFIASLFLWNDCVLFDGMFYTNRLIGIEKSFLNFGTWLIVILASDWLKNKKHIAEYYILLLSSLLGIQLMISSGNFLMFYLGLELSSIPLSVLVNFDLEKKRSSEAGMKMIFSSAFASAILLFGISWIYGLSGSLNFKEIIAVLPINPMANFAMFMVLAGFAFKLSIVPFHFWTADVYEGAPISITAFLALISKASMLFVLLNPGIGLFSKMGTAWEYFMLSAIVLTLVIGNLFALRQNNIKRFLAFSSIAQMAYILMALLPGQEEGKIYMMYFLPAYLFSSLLIFTVASVFIQAQGKEYLEDYNAFYRNNKFLGWMMAIGLFSLAGIPPTAGFFGKIFLLNGAAASGHFILILFSALNMIISLYYYLRFIKAMFINKSNFPPEKIKVSLTSKFILILSAFMVLGLGFYGELTELIKHILN